MAIPVIVAISRSPLERAQRNKFMGMNDIERVACLSSWNPAALGVHPGDPIYIYALDFNIKPGSLTFKVNPVGVTFQGVSITRQNSLFSDATHDYVEIMVYVPTMAQLRNSNSYASNALMMWLQYQIENPSSGEKSPASIPILIWMPWPVIVAISRSPLDDPQINAFKAKNDFDRAAFLIGWDPAVLGVYPGESIYIYVLDFNTDPALLEYTVTPVDPKLTGELEIKKQKPILADNYCDYTEIEVRTPTLDELEKCDNYARNALMMGLQFQIESPSGGKSWNSTPILIWMPWPLIAWVWNRDTDTITVGTKDPQGGTQTTGKITKYLGLEKLIQNDKTIVFGEIRWYSLENAPKLPPLFDFADIKKSFGPDGKLVTVLPEEIGKTLGEIRQYKGGEPVSPLSPPGWSDTYVSFKNPHPEEAGVAIIWRDDLPSCPILLNDVVNYVTQQVEELVKQLWQANVSIGINVNSGDPYPIPLGSTFSLAVEWLADKVNNLLAKWLWDDGEPMKKKLTVSFAFLVTPYNASNFKQGDLRVESGPKGCIGAPDKVVYESVTNPKEKGALDLALKLRVCPKVSWKEPTPEECGAFAVQLSVKINGSVKLFEREHEIDVTINLGLPLVFQPDPLILPTMAIFFQHPDFTGAPLVMFPKDMVGIPAELNNMQIDDTSNLNDPNVEVANLAKIKAEIWGKLDAVMNGLNILKFFINIPYINILIDIMGRIKNIAKLVLNTQGKINDLSNAMINKHWDIYSGDDETFNRSITSVLLVGVPFEWSKTVVKCYENSYDDPNGRGEYLELVLPNDCFVAALADLRVLLPKPKDYYNFMGVDIQLPYGNGIGNQPGKPDIDNFDDRIRSIEFTSLDPKG